MPTEFDLNEWMSDLGFEQGGEGDWEGCRPIEKRHCDVRLKDGTVVGPCWPNRGCFVDLSSENEDRMISLADVASVRYYKEVCTGQEEDGREDAEMSVAGYDE